MPLLENIVITESIDIKTTPDKIFDFFKDLVDDESYRAWHPEDHVSLRWLKGGPWEEGSLVYAEEYMHGKLHKLTFVITKVVPGEVIEFAPASRLLRIYFPLNRFTIKAQGDTCTFTTTGTVRVGRLVKTFARKKLEQGLASVRKHMKEEGENLKKILEAEGH